MTGYFQALMRHVKTVSNRLCLHEEEIMRMHPIRILLSSQPNNYSVSKRK